MKWLDDSIDGALVCLPYENVWAGVNLSTNEWIVIDFRASRGKGIVSMENSPSVRGSSTSLDTAKDSALSAAKKIAEA